MKNERLGDHVLYPEARVKRTERVLEDDLHIAPNTPQFGGVRLQQIDALEEDRARSRLDETEDEASQRTLARAGFTNQAQRLAFMNVEGNIVDGANLTHAAAAERRFGQIENLGQVADFKQGHGERVSANEERRQPWLPCWLASFGHAI